MQGRGGGAARTASEWEVAQPRMRGHCRNVRSCMHASSGCGPWGRRLPRMQCAMRAARTEGYACMHGCRGDDGQVDRAGPRRTAHRRSPKTWDKPACRCITALNGPTSRSTRGWWVPRAVARLPRLRAPLGVPRALAVPHNHNPCLRRDAWQRQRRGVHAVAEGGEFVRSSPCARCLRRGGCRGRRW